MKSKTTVKGKPGMYLRISTTLVHDTALRSIMVDLKHKRGSLSSTISDLCVLTSHSYSVLPPTPKPAQEPTVSDGKVEMVTVPALGAEWGKEEMYQMTKTGRKERKQEARNNFWKSWNRGERGLCGRYLTRKVLVFFLFGLCCVYVFYQSPLT
jgi:hypothetical protein